MASSATNQNEYRGEGSAPQQKLLRHTAPTAVFSVTRDVPNSLYESSDIESDTAVKPHLGHDFSRIRVHAGIPKRLQTKLSINRQGDKYEQEADRVAEQVMRVSIPLAIRRSNREKNNQAKPISEQTMFSIQKQVDKGKEGIIITKKVGEPIPQVSSGLKDQFHFLKDHGNPMAETLRDFIEPRFGCNFSNVRIHADSNSAKMSEELKAEAFSYGRDIYFGAGKYRPGSESGKRLLAHELTHILQQQFEPKSSGSVQLQQESAEPVTQVNPEIAQLPAALNVDKYESIYYDLSYRAEDGYLSTWLTVTYADGTVIDINIRDIGDDTMTGVALRNSFAQGYMGEGGRVFPQRMNQSTTPRLWAAKQSAIQAREEYNYQLMTQMLPAVLFIITMPLMVSGGRAQAVRRPVTRRIVTPSQPNVFDRTLEFALRPNTMRHIFGKAQHGLDPLVRQLGSEEAVMREVVRRLSRATLPQAGQYQVVVSVMGMNVTVRGAVVGGVPRISTMFVAP